MAIVYPTSDIVTTGNAINVVTPVSVSSGDTLIIDEDIAVVSTDNNALNISLFTAFSLFNNGLLAADLTAVDARTLSANATLSIENGDTGRIVSNQYYTLDLLVPEGSTTSRLSVNNNGEIVSMSSAEGAMFLAGWNTALITNSGTIMSAATDSTYTSVYFFDIDTVRASNTGTIVGASTGFTGANYDDVAAVGFGTGTDDVIFTNSGTITAPLYSIGSDALTFELIINSGTLNGSVAMSNTIGGVLQNSGAIWGDVEMRGGDDDYRGYVDGFVSGTVFGQAGADVLVGSNAADSFDGGADSDVLRGRMGDDTLIGGTENDRLYGDEGNDRVQGDAGNDALFGGAGEDVLVGGNGLDVLFGGADADTFIYNSFADSEEGGLFDRIRDFTPGEDKINLLGVASGIDFTDVAFSGTGPEVRAFLTSAGLQLVQVDYDGDGSADMRIALLGTTELVTESDFIL